MKRNSIIRIILVTTPAIRAQGWNPAQSVLRRRVISRTIVHLIWLNPSAPTSDFYYYQQHNPRNVHHSTINPSFKYTWIVLWKLVYIYQPSRVRLDICSTNIVQKYQSLSNDKFQPFLSIRFLASQTPSFTPTSLRRTVNEHRTGDNCSRNTFHRNSPLWLSSSGFPQKPASS